MRAALRLLPLLLALGACRHAAPASPTPAGAPFLRTEAPPAEPQLFRPGLMDTLGIRRSPVFTRDGRQLFWAVDHGQFRSALMTARLERGGWTRPEPLPFSHGDVFDHNPAVSADGRTLVFASNRPIEGKQATTLPGTPVPTSDLFVSHRSGDGWSEPRPLGEAFNTTYDDDSPVLAADGTLFFSSARPGAPGPGGIYMAAKRGDGWDAPVLLRVVNTAAGEMVTGVAPDGSYLLFYSMREGDAAGLYASFRNAKGEWLPPVRLPQVVRARLAYAANVTADGKAVLLTAPVDRTPRIYILDEAIIRAVNGIPFTTSRVEKVTFQTGVAALRRFTPVWDATIEGGECVMKQAVSPGLTRMSAQFPDTRNPFTSITVVTDSAGRMFEYSEQRGVPRPAKSVEEIQAQLAAMPRTLIHLQYDRNRATIANAVPGRPQEGVVTTVDEFLASGRFGNFPERVALVRKTCAGQQL